MRASTVAAVLLPSLVLAAGARWLTTEVERPVGAIRARNDAALAANPPGLVIIGNSKAGSDLDATMLAKELGYSKPVTTTLVMGSSAPAWYAMLEQRVYGQGYTPEVVVIYGQLGALLRTEVQRQSERDAVEAQLTTSSAVLDAKVFKQSGGPLVRARKRASALHDTLLTGLRDLSIGALLAPPHPEGARVGGAALATTALGEVFGENAKFHQGRSSKLIGVEAVAATTTAMQAGDTPPAESLIPDMVALAKEHGSTIVFVRAPLPASTAYTDSLPQATERAVVDLLESLGASWIDLHAEELPSTAWKDGFHMLRSGEAALTRTLAERMRAANVLGGGVARSRSVLVPTRVARIGDVALPPLTFVPARGQPCGFRALVPGLELLGEPLLQASGIGRASPFLVEDDKGQLQPFAAGKTLGQTCGGEWRYLKTGLEVAPRDTPSTDGLRVRLSPEPKVAQQGGSDVWWVYPETKTEWTFAEAWDGPLHVEVAARGVGETAGGTLRVGDAEVRLEPDGRLLRAALELPSTGAAWSLSIAADPGSWLVLEDVRLGVESPQRLVGTPPVTLNAIAGAMTSTPPPAVVSGAPGEDRGAIRIPLPGLEGMTDDALRTRLGQPCSPVQVTGPDGTLWTAGRAGVQKIAKSERAYGHIGDALFASPPGPVTLALDPGRACLARRWVYPGDVLGWGIGGGPVAQLRLGADQLVLVAHTFTDAPVTLGVSLTPRQRGAAVATSVTLAAGTTRTCVPLDPPLPPRVPMDLAITGDPSAWVLLESVEIGESEHMEGCPE